MLVDVTPGVNRAKAEPILEFIQCQQTFASFAELLDYTAEFNPTRSSASLRRGVLNNAKELPDGSWTWRWDPTRAGEEVASEIAFQSLWPQLAQLTVPLWLLRLQPDAEVIVVPDAGHSIQGDQPVELAAMIAEFMGG